MADMDHIEAQLALIDLISAMYPDSTSMSAEDAEAVNQLRKWTSGQDAAQEAASSTTIRLTVCLLMGNDSSRPIELNVSFDTLSRGDGDKPALAYTIRQPGWLSRSQVAELSVKMPRHDVIDALSFLSTDSAEHLCSAQAETIASIEEVDPSVRVWFYFPSISTREKRNDIVKYAPTYNLTGFLLAGKPGLLCLEGDSRNIDEYMKFIKTQSWGDIPSHQKKVSERLRENNIGGNVFKDMTEITDAPFMGEKSGQRGNRTDMQTLEEWLRTKGLGGAFEKIVF